MKLDSISISRAKQIYDENLHSQKESVGQHLFYQHQRSMHLADMSQILESMTNSSHDMRFHSNIRNNWAKTSSGSLLSKRMMQAVCMLKPLPKIMPCSCLSFSAFLPSSLHYKKQKLLLCWKIHFFSCHTHGRGEKVQIKPHQMMMGWVKW